jgi:hypothetical protein
MNRMSRRTKLILHRWRWLNKLYASIFGYFWLPCPICGEYFGGHEWLDGHDLYYSAHSAKGVCYKKECYEKSKQRSKIKIAYIRRAEDA